MWSKDIVWKPEQSTQKTDGIKRKRAGSHLDEQLTAFFLIPEDQKTKSDFQQKYSIFILYFK